MTVNGGAEGPEMMTKAEYARYRGFSASRLTALLNANRIHGEAIHGEGRNAKIVVAIADAQLQGQDPAKVLAAQMRADRPAAVAPPAQPTAAVRPAEDDATSRYNRARAEEAEMRVARERERRAGEKGQWMPTDEARQLVGRAVADVIDSVEAWIYDASVAVADAAGCDARTVEVSMRETWRAHRQAQADRHAARRSALPPTLPPVEPRRAA